MARARQPFDLDVTVRQRLGLRAVIPALLLLTIAGEDWVLLREYELTELGWGLEEPVVALGRWGMWTLRREAASPEFRPLWAGAGLRIVFRPEKAAGVHETYEVRIDAEVFHLRVDDGRLEAERGPARKPDLVMACDSGIWLAMGSLSLTPADAIAKGRLKIEGSPTAMANFARVFKAPTAIPRP